MVSVLWAVAESAAGFAGQVIGQGRIGVRIASLVSYLRTSLRLPIRAIQSHLATLHNLQLSVGEIVELTHSVRQQLQPQAEQLKAAVQSSAVVHGDETGWRENGQNGYVWAFVTAGPPRCATSSLIAAAVTGSRSAFWAPTCGAGW